MKAMNPGSDRQNANHVIAVFADSLLAFDLPRGATLEELATRLAYLGERHQGAPLSITVRPSGRSH